MIAAARDSERGEECAKDKVLSNDRQSTLAMLERASNITLAPESTSGPRS